MTSGRDRWENGASLRLIRKLAAITCIAGAGVVFIVIRNHPEEYAAVENPARKPESPLPARVSVLGREGELHRDDIRIEKIPAELERLLDLAADHPARESALPLLRRWAESEPSAAAAWVTSRGAGDFRTASLSQVALAWAERDLTEAAMWARSLDDPAEGESALHSITNEAVRTDPVAALGMAAELTASPSSDELVRRAVMEWVVVDAEAAAAWTRDIEDESLRGQVLSGVSLAWSDADPTSAARLAADELPPGRAQADAVVGVVQRWAQRDPARAAEWVASFPEGTLRRDAIQNLLQQWSRIDPAEANRWAAARK